jgi:hypothetical protein
MPKVVSLFPWSSLSSDSFDSFWKHYPRRVNKQEALRAWNRLSAQDRMECLRTIPLHAAQWERAGTEWRFIPHAATWLNQRRFEDELESVPDLGQCEWNKNGTREPGRPRCSAAAEHTNEKGNVYCQAHAVSLGLVRRKA